MRVSVLWGVVLDTNVVFEGLTQQKGTSGLVIDAWLTEVIGVHVSDALAYEYMDVLSRKLSPERWQQLQTALATLLGKAHFVPVYFSWRPSSPDPGDDLVIDCAMNASVPVVTWNSKDFRRAQKELGLQVLTPLELVALLLRK